MFKLILLISLVSAYLYADITLKEISAKPTSRAKDFLIWQYLKQNITDEQAKKAYAQSSKKNYRVESQYTKKIKDPYILYKKNCIKKRDLFAISDEKCFNLALDPYKTLAMSKKDRNKLATKVKSPKFIKLLSIQNESYSTKAYRKYPAETILTMFINTTSSHRRNNLNIKLDKEFINYLASSNKIHYFIKMLMRDERLNNLRESLLLLDSPLLNAEDNFFLALHHLKYKSKKLAIEHLKTSYGESKQSEERDKSSFWLYLLSKDGKYLNQLLLSSSINIYTLYAHEKKNIPIENYFWKLKTDNSKAKIDISNPFEWDELRKEIKNTPKEELLNLVSKYKQDEMLPVQSYIMEKMYGFKVHGYIMPYEEYLKDKSNDDKALVYAIMRQESNFIPSALSSSFALGLMQMMPFLVDAISKDMKLKTNYSDMFKPDVNIKYALRHIKWMRKSLYHPLFMAYAYNGGMGYLKKHLETGAFSVGEYEPFLSMEFMFNSESREYGKKVLANYVMYKKILGEDTSIIRLFQMLTNPKKTDHFRAKS